MAWRYACHVRMLDGREENFNNYNAKEEDKDMNNSANPMMGEHSVSSNY